MLAGETRHYFASRTLDLLWMISKLCTSLLNSHKILAAIKPDFGRGNVVHFIFFFSPSAFGPKMKVMLLARLLICTL